MKKAYLTGGKVYENKAEAFLRSEAFENIEEVKVVVNEEIYPDADEKGVFIAFEDGVRVDVFYKTYTDIQQGNDPDDMNDYPEELVDLDRIYVYCKSNRHVNIKNVGFTQAEINRIQNACENHNGQNG